VSRRVREVPPYLFAEIDRARDEAIARGIDVISLGIGDPDQPTPAFVIEAMAEEIAKAENHTYSPYWGTDRFRQAVAGYMKGRFGVELDPGKEVIALIGAKEGLGHLPLALLDPGDLALIPDPAYPVYENASRYAGAATISVPLLEENGFLPDLSALPESVLRTAKVIFLNYPNNPTGALAPLSFLEELVELAHRFGFYIVSDNPYAEIYFDEEHPPHSILEVEGAREVAIELHSFSKTFNMTGWRIGWACGAERLVAALGSIKSNMDSGPFKAIQHAVVRALSHPQCGDFIRSQRELMRKRLSLLKEGLSRLGLRWCEPGGAFYLWVHLPEGYQSSIKFCSEVLNRAGLVFGPGRGYGVYGEGYFRICLTTPEEKIAQAMERLAGFLAS